MNKNSYRVSKYSLLNWYGIPRTCAICGEELNNTSWKICKSCYEFVKDQKRNYEKREQA